MADKTRRRISPATRQQGNESADTIGKILDAAQQVLVAKGYAGLTMRLVAHAAGISPGNLTYHFPKKNLLLRALIQRLLEEYSRQLDEMLSGAEVAAGQEIETLVHFAFMDNIAEETVRISRELWAMALHDAVIREVVDDFYDKLMARLVGLLQRSRPHVDQAVIQEMVHFLILLAEGTTVLFGTRQERAVAVERLIEVASRLLKTLEQR